MTLLEHSAAAGQSDGSFTYLGYQVAPLTGSPHAACDVSRINEDTGYSSEGMRFDSWLAGRAWIEFSRDLEEEGKALLAAE